MWQQYRRPLALERSTRNEKGRQVERTDLEEGAFKHSVKNTRLLNRMLKLHVVSTIFDFLMPGPEERRKQIKENKRKNTEIPDFASNFYSLSTSIYRYRGFCRP